MQILVADDEPGIRSLIKDALAQAGHEVQCAENGTEAVQIVKQCHFDAVFMDIRMPGGDGVWALEEIKKSHPNLPVVMITGCGKHEKMEDALALGSLACLIKPFRLRDVMSMLDWVDAHKESGAVESAPAAGAEEG